VSSPRTHEEDALLGALATAAAGRKITTANQPLVVDLLAARLDQPVAVAALHGSAAC
jgi:hypothetical protein